ncbi:MULTISPECIES: hypothetical protein [unclassified Rhizobium]|nr:MULTISPECIES: hypothetical protein [unclassified Rhizobium]MBN8954745.1 hypothetical protein [Rhizobium tropici]RKD72397.1 hypothetical protein BJ928_102182 [Rhizobium sp. WW_1]
MTIVDLQNGSLSARVLIFGGTLLDYSWIVAGNRIRNNACRRKGCDYEL